MSKEANKNPKKTEEDVTFINDLREDGTRVEGYIDKRTGKAHFMTFDADGKMINCCPEDDLRDFPHQKWFSCNFWVIRGLEGYKLYAELSEEENKALSVFKCNVLASICLVINGKRIFRNT